MKCIHKFCRKSERKNTWKSSAQGDDIFKMYLNYSRRWAICCPDWGWKYWLKEQFLWGIRAAIQPVP